jgi:hypothetical protein
MKPNIGLSEKNLKSITGLLSAVLSDAILLYTKKENFIGMFRETVSWNCISFLKN